jgi:hypothetical protein
MKRPYEISAELTGVGELIDLSVGERSTPLLANIV